MQVGLLVGFLFLDFFAVHESAAGPSRHLVRCSDMSEVGGKPEVPEARPK